MIKYSNSKRIKKCVSSVLICCLLIAFCATLPVVTMAQESNTYIEVSVKDAYKMVKKASASGLIILDVRNQSEFDVGHLYDAKLIPVYMLENLSSLSNYPPPVPTSNDSLSMQIYEDIMARFHLQEHVNDPILVYCKSGARSMEACQILVNNGYAEVYNMQGGIVEWMENEYNIFTSYHHVTVDSSGHGKNIQIDIEPMLLDMANCDSCQNQTCPSSFTPSKLNITTLEDSEEFVSLLISDSNGTPVETIDKTLLWSSIDVEGSYTRTVTLVSSIITSQDQSEQLFGLYDSVQHENYNLTMLTMLKPLDSESYNRSATEIHYFPAEDKEVTSIEKVVFNEPVTLSELYDSLGKVLKKLGKEYQKSSDEKLQLFAERYFTMSDETKHLSKLIQNELQEYDKNIIHNKVLIFDDTAAEVCGLICGLVIFVGCTAVCAFTMMTACYVCVTYWSYFEAFEAFGCYYICNEIDLDIGDTDDPPEYIDSVILTDCDGDGSISGASNIIGLYADQNYAIFSGFTYGDTAKVVLELNELAEYREMRIRCMSAQGYSSNILVYVSSDYTNWYNVWDSYLAVYIPINLLCDTDGYQTLYVAICGYNGGNDFNFAVDSLALYE